MNLVSDILLYNKMMFRTINIKNVYKTKIFKQQLAMLKLLKDKQNYNHTYYIQEARRLKVGTKYKMSKTCLKEDEKKQVELNEL